MKLSVLSVLILGILVFSAVRLAIVDLHAFKRLQSIRSERQQMRQPWGSYVGFDLDDGSAWSADDIGLTGSEEDSFSVLFSAANDIAHRKFWSDIVRETQASIIDTLSSRSIKLDFIGVCVNFEDCLSPIASPSEYELLSFMSLSHMHALAYAESDEMAFLLRGKRFLESIAVHGNPEEVSSKIVQILLGESRENPYVDEGVSP